MNRGYNSGLPYSDELKHYGIVGMKWGVRRYQNKDGTRTEAGKLRYRTGGEKTKKEPIGDVSSSVAKGAKRLGQGIARGVKGKLAEKFPFMLSDEELQRYNDRLRAENNFRNSLGDKRIAKRKGKTDSFITEVAKNTVRNAANVATNRAMNKVMDRALENSNERTYRKMKEANNIASETEKSLINELNESIRERETSNVNDTARKQDNQNEISRLTKEMYDSRKKLANIKNDEIRKILEVEVATVEKAKNQRIKDLVKENKQLTSNINDRTYSLNEMKKTLSKQGFTMYSNKDGKGGKGNLSKDDIKRIVDQIKEELDNE